MIRKLFYKIINLSCFGTVYWFLLIFFTFVKPAYAVVFTLTFIEILQIVVYVVAIGAAVYGIVVTARMSDKNNFPSSKYTAGEINNTYSNEPIVPIVYGGPLQVGGNIFWQSEPGETVKRFLGLSIGECHSITDERLDDILISELDGCSCTFYNGSSTQIPDERADGECKGLRNVCYVAATIQSGEKISRNPILSVQLTGRKILTWNETNQDWTTNEKTASKNPAAIVRDYLLLSSVLGGAGLSAGDVDDISFGAAFEYCQEAVELEDGGEEPRFELTISIDTEHPALDQITKMLITCSMGLIKGDGVYKLIIDRNDSTKVFDFDKDNIVKNTFSYGYGSNEEPTNKVFVEWWKPDELKNPMRRAWAEDTVDINRNGERPLVIEAVGIDRQTQALRMAKQILYEEKVNNAWAKFEGTIESIHLEPGDLVSVTHDYPGWDSKLFVIKGITEVDFGRGQFHLKSYNATILDDKMNAALTGFDIPTITNPWAAVVDPSNIRIAEANFQDEDGTYATHLTLTWDPPATGIENLAGYIIQMKIGSDGEWSTVNTAAVGDKSFTLMSGVIVGSTYFFKIKTHSQENIISNGVESNPYVVQGASARPYDVNGFGYTFNKDITLYWNPSANTDIDSYEIRLYDNGWGNNDSDLIFRGNATKYFFTPSSRAPGTYHIRARNNAGRYSYASVSVTPTNSIPDAPGNLTSTVFFNVAQIKWDNIIDDDLKYYDVYTSYNNKFEGEEVRSCQSPGSSALIEGETSKAGVVESGDITTVIDSNLSGFDNYARIGDILTFTSGVNEGEERNVVDYNRETGTFYLDENLPNVPQAGDKFIIIDVLYVRVRAVDEYGNGPFSNSLRLEFEAIDEDMLTDQIVTARKIYAGEVITLSAQIKDAIITNAHVLNMSADKITAGTIQAALLILGSGGEFMSENYVQNTSGFRMWESGLEINDGAINADLVLIAGASLQSQFLVTEQNTVHDQDGTGVNGWEKDGYSTSNVTINETDLSFTENQTIGYYISPAIEVAQAALGTVQWEDSILVYKSANVASGKTYTAGYTGGTLVSNASNCFDGNTTTTATWVDGTSKWGQSSFAAVDLGEEMTISRVSVYAGNYATDAAYLQYSDDGISWSNAVALVRPNQYDSVSFDAITARYWRYISQKFVSGHDGNACKDFKLYETAEVVVKVYTRTSDAEDMLSPSEWQPGDGLTNKAGSQMTSPVDDWLQYKVEFSSSDAWGGTVKVTSVQVNYDIVVARDSNKLGGFEISETPTANKVVPLDDDGEFPISVIKDATISQPKLKTSIGEVSQAKSSGYDYFSASILAKMLLSSVPTSYTTNLSMVSTDDSAGSTTTEHTLPGGEYGFYPQGKGSATVLYFQQRYVTASGRDHWIFLLVAKADIVIDEKILYKKGYTIAAYQAPDHPSTNNGGNALEIPHPFGSYDPLLHEIIIVNNEILKSARTRLTRTKSLLEVINEDFIVDDTKTPRYEPREIIQIDENDWYEGEIIKTLKTPDWAKIIIQSDNITLKRQVIEHIPANMLFKNLALKNG